MIARVTIQAGAGLTGKGTPETVSQLCPGDRRNPAETPIEPGGTPPKNGLTKRNPAKSATPRTFGGEV